MTLVEINDSIDYLTPGIGGRSLEELATIANREHQDALLAASAAFAHAVRMGEALNQAFTMVPRGEWAKWVDENCNFSANHATLSRRIAYFADELRASGIDTVGKAEKHLKDEKMYLPWVGGHPMSPAEIRQKKMIAQTLRQKGLSYKAIADELAIKPGRAWEFCNPQRVKEIRAQQIRDRAAARRARRDQTMRVAGGATHEGYALLRKALAVLQTAFDREADGDAKRALGNAISKLHGAEDEMYRAVKLSKEAA